MRIGWFFYVARFAVWVLLKVMWRIEVRGAEHVPRDGPLIVAANHVAYMDPPSLGAALPRPIQYMAKSELFRIPVLGAIIRAVGTYPVDRGKGDIQAIRRSLEVLRGGGAIGIFPEGTRNLDGRATVHTGVALLAAYSGAPVQPAYIWGSARAKHLHKIIVAFGPPLHFPKKSKADRDELERWREQIMGSVVALGESIDREH